VNLKYRFDGPEDAPVLVLSNSLGSSVEMWEPVLPVFAERFRVLRYDQRGHGASPVPPGPYAIEDFGRDTLELLDQLGLERVFFCGLSLGGAVGMWLGANAPERLDALALCCTAARFGTPELWAERSAAVREAGSVEPLADAVLERWLTPGFRAERPADAARVRAMLVATPAEGYAAACDALADCDLRESLGSLRTPTLVLAGADDPATPPTQAEEIAAAIQDARLVIVPDAAHFAQLEQPDAFAGAVLEHLQQSVA
jgi:3-oxoadipate enol-lactonase